MKPEDKTVEMGKRKELKRALEYYVPVKQHSDKIMHQIDLYVAAITDKKPMFPIVCNECSNPLDNAIITASKATCITCGKEI